ncbi:protein FAM237A-like [Electrophorus electricus]|uniref:protein FAM237A-like n=1 Tax=Electrophorus electricus TaxID=8005 RepID=UPI0015D0AAA7|nr:protein FAM237A-like [Electrophorus electricus]
MDSTVARIVGNLGCAPRRWRSKSLCLLLLAAASVCTRSNPAALNAEVPANLGEINGECWDASSLAVIEVRRLRIADTVGGFWDFMTYLRASQLPKHQDLFMKLAQVFWERYVDCVLSRAHGLGRRAGVSPRERILCSHNAAPPC